MWEKRYITQAKWWEQLLLRFKFKHYYVVEGSGLTVVYKELRGRVYVLTEIPMITMAERIAILERQGLI